MHTLNPQPLGNNDAARSGLLTSIPYTQYIGRSLDGYSATFAPNTSRIVNTFIIYQDHLSNFVAYVLGFCWSTAKMSRYLPMQNPEVPWTHATAITDVKPLGIDPVYRAAGSIRKSNGYGPYPAFQFYKVTVVFTTPNYEIVPDSSVTLGSATVGEQTRFLERIPVGTVEILTSQNGQFVWDPVAPSGSQPVIQSPGYAVPKVRERWVWHDVPDAALYSNGGAAKGGIPTKLLAALGTVNQNAFMGYPVGTLLLNGYQLTPRVLPIDPNLYAQLNGLLNPFPLVRSWDVALDIIYFDPNPNYTVSRYPYHGHNLLPNPASAGGVAAGRWFLAYQQGGTLAGGPWLYAQTQFEKIFTPAAF